MKNITFDGWKLMGTLPWQPDFSKWMSDGEMYPGLTDWIDASVPGCVYQDLFRAGLIDDPYFGVNSLACEWVANRWWLYRTSFSLTEDDLGEHLELTFHGIDYAAKIYLNGQLLGEHEGMFIPFSACVNETAHPGKNVLVCVLEHAPFCAPQPGYTSKTHYLKSRFNYKWDFAARLVSLGLYDQVTLTAYPLASISGSYIRPVRHEEQWTLEIDLSVTSYRTGCAELSLSLSDPSGHPIPETPAVALSLSEGLSEYHFSIQVKDPLLWWPNGYGAQPLYRLQARLLENGALSDEKSWNTGFRTLSYFHADGREDALAYGVCINGRRIYLKGTNIVPFDCMTGAVTRQKLHSQLGAAKDANINFFRIWGGGNIESEAFYELCDEMGILVMQEFTMSSSGCDDVPSRDPHFIALLERALTSQLPIKRNHLCLTFLCGGNELTDIRYLGREDHEGHPASFEDSTLARLKKLADALCPDIQMLPASASGPNALLDPSAPGKNHDVHGPWGYAGVREHYALYNSSDSILHGEFGCGGMTSLSAIERFTLPEDRRLSTTRENRVWAHHSGGWDSYSTRELLLFGDLRTLPLEDYIRVSQYIQAESLRYSLESNRRRQWKNVGEMTWQFNEPWPNIQCSNVIDYYSGKKLAWYAMRDAYAPVLASLRYDSLFYAPGERFEASLSLLSDLPDCQYSVTCTVTDEAGCSLFPCGSARLDFCGSICQDQVISFESLTLDLPETITGSFSVRIHTECGDFSNDKEYLFLIADKDLPLELRPEEESQIQERKGKGLANGLYDKRADVRSVLAYVKRLEQSVSET